MPDDEQEKTEQPTPKKLEKAKEEGEVPSSQEIPTVAVIAAAMGVFAFAGTWMWGRLQGVMVDAWTDMSAIELHSNSLFTIVGPLVLNGFSVVVPLALTTLVVGVIAYIGQFGLLFTAKVLAPKPEKLNPISGFKKLFSYRSMFEAFKGFAKVILIGLIVAATIKSELNVILESTELTPYWVVTRFWILTAKVMVRVIIALTILAVIDLLYQRHSFTKKQKMTKQEVKDEIKNTDGDPKVKARIRRIQMEMATRRMMQEVPKADVVITNPTHVAVALRYRRIEDKAPRVLAKGRGLIAAKIREKAKEAGIPILERKALAWEIFKRCELGELIPMDLYQVVAEILAFLFSRKKGGMVLGVRPEA